MDRSRTGPREPSKQQRSGKKKEAEEESGAGSTGPLPDLLRRAVTAGLSSLFTTEEAIRKAVGDTVPQDWVDFAALQSDRARAEFLDRLVSEFGRVIENVDLPQLIEQVMEGRSVEINAQIRFGPHRDAKQDDEAAPTSDLSFRLSGPAAGPKASGGAKKSRSTTAAPRSKPSKGRA